MENGTAPNAKRLLWAGFFAILAAGVGFSIRGGFLNIWKHDFLFTDTEIGHITGAGGPGFCFGIIIGGLICDKIGYGKLVIAAFLLHIVSALVTFAAMPAPAMDKETAHQMLYWGTFLFNYANGTLEAVANPLVATLFFHNRTHYLNILHASWPAGLVLGSFSGWVLTDVLPWKAQFALFLIPTVLYGLLFFAQTFPKSEASQRGLKLGSMFKDVGLLGGLVVCALLALFFGGVFGSVGPTASILVYGVCGALLIAVGVITNFSVGSMLLFALFIAHGLVGSVELGTDNWIQNNTGNILTSGQGKLLFVWASLMMFALRFCANFIEKKMGLSPVGILLTCAVLACVGLFLLSNIATFIGALLAVTVYAVGKTFFWPTMLAVGSDRFPRTGAVAISMMGGVGMMAFGVIGSPGLGYAKDRFAGEALESNPAAFAEYKAAEDSAFLPWIFDKKPGLDPKKLGAVQTKLQDARKELAKAGIPDPKAALDKLTTEERAVIEASIAGDRKMFEADAFIPATMAVIYLILLIYFKAIGGYKPLHLEEELRAEGQPTEPQAE
jgi:MFS family permease